MEFGGIPLKPRRTHHIPILNYNVEDLVPSREEAEHVQAAQLWHIKDILYDANPALHVRLGTAITPVPSVLQIPIHKSKQYPLSAMHIDKSSLEGTLAILDRILQGILGLEEDNVKKHGLIICAHGHK